MRTALQKPQKFHSRETTASMNTNTAKVAGFMVGDSGEGVVTINKVGTFACTISR